MSISFSFLNLCDKIAMDSVRARYQEDLQVSSQAPRTEAHCILRGTGRAQVEYYLISEWESEQERMGVYTISAKAGDLE